MGQFVKKVVQQDSTKSQKGSFPDPAFLARWPALAEYLTLTEYDSGARREVSTLLLMVGDGRLKACLNDRSESRACWVSGDSLDAVLDALEANLRSDTADWRAVRPWDGGRGRKR